VFGSVPDRATRLAVCFGTGTYCFCTSQYAHSITIQVLDKTRLESLGAPMPYIVGLLPEFAQYLRDAVKKREVEEENLVIVTLASGTVETSASAAQCIPDDFRKVLTEALHTGRTIKSSHSCSCTDQTDDRQF
jgi:hypothetical protein